MPTVKLRPAQLGCGRPYFTGYSTRLKAKTHKGEAAVSAFIDRYNTACNGLFELVKGLFAKPENHLALYALFLPSQVPETIRETRFWKENMLSGPAGGDGTPEGTSRQWADSAPVTARTTPRPWSHLNRDSTYVLLCVLAAPRMEAPATRPARTWQQMIAEYGLACDGLESKKLEEIFRPFPDLEMRKRIGESVGSVVRLHLTLVEVSKKSSAERRQVKADLEKGHPEFFRELMAFVEDDRSWRRACRYYAELRRQKRAALREAGLKAGALGRATGRDAPRCREDEILGGNSATDIGRRRAGGTARGDGG